MVTPADTMVTPDRLTLHHSRMQVKVRCPGKVILFGEHASVYGHPSLVTTISAYTQVVFEPLIDEIIHFEAPAFDYKSQCKVTLLDDVVPITDTESERKACEQIRQILSQKQSVREDSWFLLLWFYHKVVPESDRFGLKVTATTQLWPGSGLGSSASYCCCLAQGLLTLCGKDASPYNVNELAFQGEKVFHGTPSGVDNTACTHGGYLLYKKNSNPQFTPISVARPPKLLIINSKEAHNTAEIVKSVRAQSSKLEETLSRIGEISLEGGVCLQSGQDIGHLITENQTLLKKLPGVPTLKLDKIVELCANWGVPAKVTGAGGGGVAIALIRDDVEVDTLTTQLGDAGFDVIRDIETGVGGVHVVTHE